MPILVVSLNPAIDQTLIVPAFRAGNVHRVQADHLHAGGKGVNVALTLASLGEPVTITGFLGEPNAALFENAFESAAIENQCIAVPQPTRHGIKIVDPESRETTDLNFPGFTISPAQFAVLGKRIQNLSSPGDPVVFSGSLPNGLPSDAYAQLIQLVHARSGWTALDTSGAALANGIAAGPRLIKPNLAELAELTQDQGVNPASDEAAARHLVARQGIRRVVISMGSHGATLVQADGVWHATPPPVNVASTVGAGDAMFAGLIIAERDGWNAERSLSFATALGADAVTRFGAGGCDRSGIEALAIQIHVTKIMPR